MQKGTFANSEFWNSLTLKKRCKKRTVYTPWVMQGFTLACIGLSNAHVTPETFVCIYIQIDFYVLFFYRTNPSSVTTLLSSGSHTHHFPNKHTNKTNKKNTCNPVNHNTLNKKLYNAIQENTDNKMKNKIIRQDKQTNIIQTSCNLSLNKMSIMIGERFSKSMNKP